MLSLVYRALPFGRTGGPTARLTPPPKMAKQYLAQPASSAGVERVFSAAGKMHDNLRKSMKDSTLEHSLFAAFNTE